MGDFTTDLAWSDLFLDSIRTIVGPFLLRKSTRIEDVRFAADLIVLRADGLSIACRVRKHSYVSRYGHQFTIRAKRDSGAKTEFSKIFREGWGNWFFYGFEAGPGSRLINPWTLIDLQALRSTMMGRWNAHKAAGVWGSNSNDDGTHFVWFDSTKLPGCVLARSEPARPQLRVVNQ